MNSENNQKSRTKSLISTWLGGIKGLNKVDFDLKDSLTVSGKSEKCAGSKLIQSVLNGRNSKYHFCGGRFHMFSQSYKFFKLFVWIISFQFGS